jgi:ABC-2 type transport system ATP-binding protein
LLILDDPSNGLDPSGIMELRRTLRALVLDGGMTVFLSSHLLSEVSLIATHVGVIRRGSLCIRGTLSDLRRRARSVLQVRCTRTDAALLHLGHCGISARIENDTLLIDTSDDSDAKINTAPVHAGFAVHSLWRAEVTLERMFLDLTARSGARTRSLAVAAPKR